MHFPEGVCPSCQWSVWPVRQGAANAPARVDQAHGRRVSRNRYGVPGFQRGLTVSAYLLHLHEQANRTGEGRPARTRAGMSCGREEDKTHGR